MKRFLKKVHATGVGNASTKPRHHHLATQRNWIIGNDVGRPFRQTSTKTHLPSQRSAVWDPPNKHDLTALGKGNSPFYEYERLPNKTSFRLVVIHPVRPGNELMVECSLEVCTLGSAPPYEALSYVWDDPYAPALLEEHGIDALKDGKPACAIFCDGIPVQVTANLYLALRRLRSKSQPTLLWVDALCINQHDSEEKSHQIALMGSVYSHARKVTIWLGEEDRWSNGSRNTIRRWAQVYRMAKLGSQPELLQRLKEFRTYREEQACFEAFIRRAWFTRAWTFQELCLANEAELRCGHYSISWDDFRDACVCIINAGQERFVFEEHENIKALCDFRKFCTETSHSERLHDERFKLSALVHRTRHQEATDPRDRLYSLIGIARPSVKNPEAYVPTYDETISEVFTRFTRAMIAEDGDLRILTAIKRPHRGKEIEYWSRSYLGEQYEEHLEMLSNRDFRKSPLDKANNDREKMREYIHLILKQYHELSIAARGPKKSKEDKGKRDQLATFIKQIFRDNFAIAWELAQEALAELGEVEAHELQNALLNLGQTLLSGSIERELAANFEMRSELKEAYSHERQTDESAFSEGKPATVIPSWVPDYSEQDHVEYVASNPSIRTGLPSNLIRTRYPQPLNANPEQQLYWSNRHYSSHVTAGDITFDVTNDPDRSKLGVYGLRVGKIKSVFEMPFTSDPSVRSTHSGRPPDEENAAENNESLEESGEDFKVQTKLVPPPPPDPFNFSFVDRLWNGNGGPLEPDDLELLKREVYRPTGEWTSIAILKTMAADMLPISSRASENYKQTNFPFHYERQFWKRQRRDQLSRSKLLLPIWALSIVQDMILRWSYVAVHLWLGPNAQRKFSVLKIEDSYQLPSLYKLLAGDLDMIEETESGRLERSARKKRELAGSFMFTWFLAWQVSEDFIGNLWTVWVLGTPLDRIPASIAVSIVPFLVYWLIVRERPIRQTVQRPRVVERDPSVPVGWEFKADEVATMAPWNASSSTDAERLRDLHLIWGISCEIQNAINRASWNRIFFITDNGYIGIGPAGAIPGDEIFCLIGAHVPFVLRRSLSPATEYSRYYSIIGESYVHGVMDGQLWSTGISLKRMKEMSQKIVLI